MICRVIPYEEIPERGKEPFLFISYCHANEAFVYPFIERLAADGFRLWYDDGIHAGEEWPEVIASHLSDCYACIEILTPEYAQSHNCRNEINFLIQLGKKIVPIQWTDFAMSLGLKLQLSATQYIKRFELQSDQMLLQRLYASEAVKACHGWIPSYRNLPPAAKKEETKKSLVLDKFASAMSAEENAGDRPTQILKGLPEAKLAAALKPAASPEPEKSQKPVPESEPEHTAGLKPVPEPAPAPVPESKPEAAPTPELKPEPAPEPEPAPAAAPEAAPEPRLEAAPVPTPKPEPKPAPAPEPEPKPEPAKRKPAPAPQPEPEPTPVYVPASEPQLPEVNPDDELTILDVPEEGTVLADEDDLDATPILPKAGLLNLKTGIIYMFYGYRTVVGRSQRANVVLDDPRHKISNRHLEIHFTNKDGWLVVDTDSTNGTKLNGEKLEGLKPVHLPGKALLTLADDNYLFAAGQTLNDLLNKRSVYLLVCQETNELYCGWEKQFVLGRLNAWPKGTLSDRRTSRVHGYIEENGFGYKLRISHKATTNGTYLNDVLLNPGQEAPLKSGDQIRTGSFYHLTFTEITLSMKENEG
ncbi:MAG: FHA domain-containing protein [Firmicutes bacterium]|nr:FHA domain-containing protein [Bacillota bacterium]